MHSLVELTLPLVGQTASAEDIRAALARPPKGTLSRLPRTLLWRMQEFVPEDVQPLAYGSRRTIVTDEGSFCDMKYCEFNRHGERHGYHYSRCNSHDAYDQGKELEFRIHWRNDKPVIYEYIPSWVANRQELRRYHDGRLHGAQMTRPYANTSDYHLRLDEYKYGLLHGDQRYYNADELLLCRFRYRDGVPLEYRYYLKVKSNVPGPDKPLAVTTTEIAVPCAAITFRDHIPNTLWARDYTPPGDNWRLPHVHCLDTAYISQYFGRKILMFWGAASNLTARPNVCTWADRVGARTLVDLALPVAGQILRPGDIRRIPRDLLWRLQCATPPINQPAIFGSATWVESRSELCMVKSDDSHDWYRISLVRVWAQHDSNTGARHGAHGEWRVAVVDTGQRGTWYPELLSVTYPIGSLPDPFHLLTDFGPKVSRAQWQNNLLHGECVTYECEALKTVQYRRGLMHGRWWRRKGHYRANDNMDYTDYVYPTNTLGGSYKDGLRHGQEYELDSRDRVKTRRSYSYGQRIGPQTWVDYDSQSGRHSNTFSSVDMHLE